MFQAAVASYGIDVALGRAFLPASLARTALAIIGQGADHDSCINLHHVQFEILRPLCTSHASVQALVCGSDGHVVRVESFAMM